MAVVFDPATRKVVGWAMWDQMRVELTPTAVHWRFIGGAVAAIGATARNQH